MKAILAIVVLAVVCAVLFVLGVVAPRRSRTAQKNVDRVAAKVARRGDRHAGRLGDATRDGVRKMRKAADASARGGRKVHDKITRK